MIGVLATSCRTPQAPPAAGAGGAALTDPFPTRFTAQQSVVMTFRPHWWWPAIRFTALGYAAVDRVTGDFSVVGLSPLGVKLFEATRRGGVEKVTMAWPMKGDADAMGRAIGQDVASLYLGLMPPAGTVRRQGGRQTTVVAENDGGRTEWTFATDTGRLCQKVERSRAGTRTVVFDDYKPVAGEGATSECPARIVLRNSRFRYTLMIRQNLCVRSE